MFKLDDIMNENDKEHYEKWLYIPDYPYRIFIIGGCGSGKTNALLNLIIQQDVIDKIYLYAKDLSKPKYKFLIEKRKNAGIKHLNDPKAFVECSNTIDNVYNNINDSNPTRKKKLIDFDDIIVDIMSNKKFRAIVKELFIRCRKINISLIFFFTVLFFSSKRSQIKFKKTI